METADEQTSEMENNNHTQLAVAMIRQAMIERKIPVVDLNSVLVTPNVVYVVEVIRTKELVLLRAKDA